MRAARSKSAAVSRWPASWVVMPNRTRPQRHIANAGRLAAVLRLCIEKGVPLSSSDAHRPPATKPVYVEGIRLRGFLMNEAIHRRVTHLSSADPAGFSVTCTRSIATFVSVKSRGLWILRLRS